MKLFINDILIVVFRQEDKILVTYLDVKFWYVNKKT